MKNIKYYILIAVAVLVVSGATLFLSKNSLPDSPLYSVKTNILEYLIAKTKRDEYVKSEYALTLAEKRLDDLEYLVGKKLLDSPKGLSVRDNFNQKTIEAQNNIILVSEKKGISSVESLTLSERLMVDIERAKVIFNIDQLEVLGEEVPIPKATSTKVKK